MSSVNRPCVPTWTLWALGAVATLVLLATLYHLIENRRGGQAWRETIAWLEERGEDPFGKVAADSSVDDEKNFWAQPLLRSVVAYDYDSDGEISYRFPEERERFLAMRVGTESGLRANIASRKRPGRTEFEEWLEILSESGEYPEPDGSGSPAAQLNRMMEQHFRREFSEIEAALREPKSDMGTGRGGVPPPNTDLFPHILMGDLIGFTKFQRLRAACLLEEGRAEEAFTCFRVGFRPIHSEHGRLLLIDLLVLSALQDLALDILWDGLCDGAWREEHLAPCAELLASVDYTARILQGYRDELYSFQIPSGHLMKTHGYVRTAQAIDPGGVGKLDEIRYFFWDVLAPEGWIDQNLAFGTKEYYTRLIAPLKEPNLAGAVRSPSFGQPPYPDPLREYWNDDIEIFAMRGCVASKVSLDQANVAVALERFRLREGSFPDTLSALVPDFLRAIPDDPFADASLRYRLAPNDQPSIYSVGLDGDDDGGEVVMGEGLQPDLERGDWVWRYVHEPATN